MNAPTVKNNKTPATTNAQTATRFKTPANLSSALTFNNGRMTPNNKMTKATTIKIQAIKAVTAPLVTASPTWTPRTVNGYLLPKRTCVPA